MIIPWVVYQTYGDTRILEENWKCMHEWVDYITNHCEENGLWMTGYQYGDWLALDKEESADRTGATDKYMIANAYYLYVTDLVKQTADPLAVQMFEQFAPGMLDGPMVQMAMQMTLAEMLGAAPEARSMFEAVVNALNMQEE